MEALNPTEKKTILEDKIKSERSLNAKKSLLGWLEDLQYIKEEKEKNKILKESTKTKGNFFYLNFRGEFEGLENFIESKTKELSSDGYYHK